MQCKMNYVFLFFVWYSMLNGKYHVITFKVQLTYIDPNEVICYFIR